MFVTAYTTQRLVERYGTINFFRISLVIIFAILLTDLQGHFEIWSPAQLEQVILPAEINPEDFMVRNRADPLYTSLLISSAFLSVLTLLGLVGANIREGKTPGINPTQVVQPGIQAEGQ